MDKERHANPANTKLTAGEIRQRYPEVFGHDVKPFKIGIFNDLLEACKGQTDRKTVYLVVSTRASSREYLDAIIAGGARYALDGSVSGEVTEKEQQYARERLAQWKPRFHNNQMDMKNRSILLKRFEASGLSRKEFAAQQDISASKLDSDLDKGTAERMARRAKRLALIEQFEQSGLNLEEFAAKSKMSTQSILRTLQKVHASGTLGNVSATWLKNQLNTLTARETSPQNG